MAAPEHSSLKTMGFAERPLSGNRDGRLGTLHSVTTGRFRESKSHRPLSGDESEERTVPSVPFVAVRRCRASTAGF